MAILNKGILARLYRKILHKFYLNDLWLDLCLAAKRDSVEYIISHMRIHHILSICEYIARYIRINCILFT